MVNTMNRLLFALLIAPVCYAGYLMYDKQDLGILQLSFAEYELKTNLLVSGAALLAGLFCILAIIQLFTWLQRIIDYFGSQRQQRLTEKARNALSSGLIELAEGRFDKAEKLLLQQVDHNDNALLAYLAAARAAQQQGAHERRDAYLRKAHTNTPTAEIAIGLTKAELQLTHSQYEQALATLTHLYELSPKHAYVLHLLGKTYQQLSDWEKLRDILKDIKQLNLLPSTKILKLEIETWCGLLNDPVVSKNYDSLNTLWQDVPDNLKQLPEITEYYANLLINAGATNQAEELLRNFLDSNWHESTIMLYSELNVQVENTPLETAEKWLQDHQHNAYLLLALGKMCMTQALWGKARHYFEASLSASPMPVTYLQLAHLLDNHMKEHSLAQQYYRLGLEHLVGKDNIANLVHEKEIISENVKPNLKLV